MPIVAKHPGECKPHEFQDRVYGKGFRLLNDSSPTSKEPMYRCTVCAPPKELGKHQGGEFALSQLVRKG
jgi:hypothetical protein